ncbi:SUMF1/EgtB/PvdO family nonheme iron enzyme [uncultured Sphaerotilus sp.]|uniref:SUMF1/EgtB/PvdO family nonheme iron enzyme n=1 Tax=uncultured Sphaerotilus sp. TaxID=474984 RepID=UPI0030CA2759
MSTQNTTIFISYRRKESRAHARLLLSALQPHFPGRVFMDVDGLKPGQNFRVRLEQQLQGCRVMVAVIGPDWHTVTDEDGQLRLHQPRDWVRLEVATALGRPIPVIPVLIENARMPDERHLPADLHPLLDIQALPLDLDGHFDDAIRQLKEAVQEFLDQSDPLPAPAPAPSPPAVPPPRHSRESGNPRNEPTSPPVGPRLRGDDGTADWWKRQIPWAKAYGEKGSDEFATPWADIEIGGVVQRMRWIEAGSFLMGCDSGDSDGTADEKPQHRVTLTKGFWLADTACTQGLWQAVTGQNPSHFKGSAELPVEMVGWDDVTGLFLPKVAQRLGVKVELPTEAEWEFACRAGTQTPYWFGQGISEKQAHFDQPFDSGRTVPVKARPANGWGLYQMHGNVWEWCAGSNRKYSAQAVENPPDGQDQNSRALRGGSWFDPAGRARSAYRFFNHRGLRRQSIGFRFSLRSIKPSR